MRTKDLTNNALRAAFEYLSGSQKTSFKELAPVCGCTPRHLSGMVSAGKTKPRNMSGELARKIAAFYGLPYEAFLELGERILNGEKGDEALRQVRAKYPVVATGKVTLPMMQIRGKGHVEPPNVEPVPMPERGRRVPLISFVLASNWGEVVDNFAPGDAEDWIECSSRVGPRAFALKVKGPSMEPEFREGDMIVVDPDIEAQSGDYVVAKNGDEEATFKRYLKDGERHYLVALNNLFPPMDMTGRPWRIVGRVMEKQKRY